MPFSLLLRHSRGMYEKPTKGFQNQRKASDMWVSLAVPLLLDADVHSSLARSHMASCTPSH